MKEQKSARCYTPLIYYGSRDHASHPCGGAYESDGLYYCRGHIGYVFHCGGRDRKLCESIAAANPGCMVMAPDDSQMNMFDLAEENTNEN